MHKVINRFKDQDGHIYEIGDEYPKSGKATKKRLAELSEVHSKYKVVFIEETDVKEGTVAEIQKGETIVPSKKSKKKE